MFTWTDIFAGAGGSSSGIAEVPGHQVVLAANHWKLAVEVHNLNHQNTDHACVDLHMEDPRNFPKTDGLWASPECTKWSQANGKAKALSVAMGGDPTLFEDIPTDLETSDQDEIDRSRLLMFDVLRFIEHHRYRAVIVENVVDIATQPKYARAWSAWQRGLRRLGYLFRVVSLNSMHAQALGAPAPQSRDRLYIVAWPEKEKPVDVDAFQRPRAYCQRCDRVVESRQAWKPGRSVGRYRAQYVYACSVCGTVVEPGWVPAAAAIDWSIQGQRIGDRERPLSEKTMARIREGLRRYAHEFLVDRRGEYRVRDLANPLSTITANETTKALVMEAAGNTYDAADPRHPRYGEPDSYYRIWPVDEPLRTLHTSMSYSTDDPLRTITTRENHGLLVPYYSASESGRPTSQPIGTLTTHDRYALVMRNNTPRGDAAQMVTPAHEPLRTLTAVGAGQSVLEPTTIDPEDCTFRMLEPHEIAAGMSFPLDYQWIGTKRDRVKLAGNAVTPPASRDQVAAVGASVGVAA